MDNETAYREGTTGEYLRGLSAVTTDKAVAMFCRRRGLMTDWDVSDVDERSLDLVSADLYMWCLTVPGTGLTVKDSDGDWSHSESGQTISAADKKYMLDRAKWLYGKWGEEVPMVSSSRVRLVNF